MNPAIVHVNFQYLCYLGSGIVIEFPVDPFKYLIDEILLVVFLFLMQIHEPDQSVPSEKYLDHHIF
jgi:hypothetical protein